MAQGLLEMHGEIDLSQFWPGGGSDADTTKVLMNVTGSSFQFRKDAASPFKATHVFEGAKVRGKATKDAIDKKGRVTIRLQGIDAPELHYQAAAAIKKSAQTKKQHELYLKWNKPYRQPLGETATVELSNFLRTAGEDPLPCVVRSAVNRPNEVFDTYGRFVGDIFVRIGGTETNVNTWLVEQGWALPTFYNSMSDTEIQPLIDAGNDAYHADRGVWHFLADQVGRLDFSLVYRGEGVPIQPDGGPVVFPKLFRRLAGWEVNKRSEMFSGNFSKFLKEQKSVCFETQDFLAQDRAATPRDLSEFVDADGTILVWPEELVFKEDPSFLIVKGGGTPKW